MKNATLDVTNKTSQVETNYDLTHQDGAPATQAPYPSNDAGAIPSPNFDRVEINLEKESGLEVKEESYLGQAVTTEKKDVAVYTRWIVAALIVATIIITASFLLSRKKPVTAENSTITPEASVEGTTLTPEQQAAIAVEVVQLRNVQANVAAPGKIAFNSNRVSPVFSQFNGRLVKLDAEVGMSVRAGQVIGMIDTPDIVATQGDYQQAVTNERSAQTALNFATRMRERAERLATAEAIPLRELQQMQADEARAKDDLTRAQSAVTSARGRLQSAGMSEAEIKNITAGARPINRLVPLKAPISGIITERKAGLGQVVQPATGDPLLMIVDLSSVWVNADIYEDQLAKIRVGAPVKIQTPAYPTETFAARVDQIGATLDPDKHTVAVRCVVPNRGNRLKPGMFASIILNSVAQQSALTVPDSAIITEASTRAVLVEEAPGRYVKRPVETGSQSEGSVIILSGLNDGDRVVVRGGLLIAAQQQGN